MDYRELAGKVRNKYPGQYDDLDDEVLARKIVEKFPQYSDTTFEKTQEFKTGADVLKSMQTGRIKEPTTVKYEVPTTTVPIKGGGFERIQKPHTITRTVIPPVTSEPQTKKASFWDFLKTRVREVEPLIKATPLGILYQAAQLKERISPTTKEDIPAIAATAATMGTGGGAGLLGLALRAGAGGAGGEAIKRVVSGEKMSPLPIVKEGGIQAGMEIAGGGVAKGITKIGPKLIEAGIDAGRRALGFMKSQLYSTKSFRESLRKMAVANRSAKEMLKKKVIPASGSPHKMAKNTMKVMDESGKVMNGVVKKIDDIGATFPAGNLGQEIIGHIDPKYADEISTVEKLVDDLGVLVKNPTIKQATELKTRWAKIGYEDKTVGSVASKIYRRASSYLDKYIDGTIKDISGDLGKQFKEAKRTYGAAATAMKGVMNKLSQEEGNMLFSLPSIMAGAGSLAFGNVPAALGALGGAELIKRRGMAVTARGLFGAGKAATKLKGKGPSIAAFFRKTREETK